MPPSLTIPLTLVRAVHFGACLILQSVFALMLFGVVPTWNPAGKGAAPAREHLCRRLHRLLVICLFVALVSGFLWIWLAIAAMSGSSLSEALEPTQFWMVLTQTQPGRVWMLRAGIALVLAISLFFAPRTAGGWKPASAPSLVAALSATLLTASLAWLGHAGACEGPQQALQLASDLLHLIAAGIWPAGLVPFAMFLWCFLKARDPASLLAACTATRRFSTLSLCTVGALVLSGIANSYFLVGNFQALLSTDYGHLLLLKLALFGATIAIGAWNLLKLTPRLATGEASLPGDAQSLALAKVTRNVLIEIALVTLILLVVGLLGITPPAIHS